MPAFHGADAPDQGSPAVPRLPRHERPSLQPPGVRAREGERREHREDGREADLRPDINPQC